MSREPGESARERGDPQVEAELRRRIRAQGRITFAEYMEVALYLLGGGYYEAHAGIGRRGDFLTSPETHPVFGALVARLVARMWRELGKPRPFTIIEYGAGTGSLCRQIVEAAPGVDGRFADSLEYSIVERSAFLRALQQAKLIELVERAGWAHPSKMGEPAVGCVLANEVVDALPAHRVRTVGGEVRELYVGLAGERYLELAGPPSRPELEAYLSESGVRPPEGSVVEICLGAREWLREAAGRLARGYVVTVDFGGEAGELYGAATARGGLKCFWRHGWTDDPYDRPGLQDITAPVDFTSLRRAGEGCGLEVTAELAQGELLARLGLGEAIGELEGLGVEARERNRQAMAALADPEGLGAYRVLVQAKGAPGFEVEALREEMAGPTPLLPEEVIPWPR